MGEPSSEWSWFPGMRWRLALCGTCDSQLGWHFEGQAPPFWGLILDRLIEEAIGNAPPR
jgi:hypothetical protein